MEAYCVLCNAALSHGEFCPSCGARQPTQAPSDDPLIGQVIAERYQIEALLTAGGMGRVYRAVQRPLDRVVAIKVVDPLALASFGPELAARFLAEARAASTLNHPNVVSIFDFGRASSSASAPLFLVMEFLVGPTLAEVHDRHRELPFDRIADILRQTLAALGEAHDHGIAHRDVKPSNIVLEPRRGGGDRVKVIDFGLARIAAERRLTEEGRLLGTPHYMAPELVTSGGAGPSADLYGVGVVLFELLTGSVPFDASSIPKLLVLHAEAPRPDPRERAPHRNIPAALAALCMRAMDVDPAKRPPDATAFARELVTAAATSPWTRRDASLFPPPAPTPTPVPTSVPMSPSAQGLPRAPTMAVETNDSLRRMRDAARTSSPSLGELPLVGRESQLAQVRETLEKPDGLAALIFIGRAGTGRTRLLAEAANVAADAGALVLDIPHASPSRYEISGTHLLALIAQLAGASGGALLHLARSENPTFEAILRDVSAQPELAGRDRASTPLLATDTPRQRRVGFLDVLKWSMGLAIARGRGARVVPLIDDLDVVDSLSRAVLNDFIDEGGLPGVLLMATSDARADAQAQAHVRYVQVTGLTRTETRVLTGGARASTTPPADGAEPTSTRRVEPLYMEHYVKWRAAAPAERAPATLIDLLETLVHALTPMQRRVLQALAVVGSATLGEMEKLLARESGAAGMEDAIRGLREAGFVLDVEPMRIAHAIVGQIVLDNAPAGVIRALHERAAASATLPHEIELRAHHAVRARVDLEALVLVKETARRRASRGDALGAIAALHAGYTAAREHMAHGEDDDVAAATGVLGCRLADALCDEGRETHAHGVLSELIGLLGPGGSGRASVLERLARMATARKRYGEAARFQREAELAAAEDDGPPSILDDPEPRTATRLRTRVQALSPSTQPSDRPSGIRSSASRADENETPNKRGKPR